jgi:hypothetical protein
MLRDVINRGMSSSLQTRSPPQSEPLAFASIPREYTWGQWRLDVEDDLWSLYWALTKTVEQSGLTLLDQMEFSDFMAFCKKHTSRPVRPSDLPVASSSEGEDHESPPPSRTDSLG